MTILSCIQNQENLGVSSCKKLPQLFKSFITTPSDFSLTPSDLDDPAAAIQALLLASKSSRGYYWPRGVMVENLNEDAVYEETVLSTLNVRDGRYRFRMSFAENLEMHKAMFSHKNFDGRIFVIDNENKIIGTVLDNGDFAGFNLDLLNPEKLTFNDGSVSSKTPVYVSLEDNRELDVNGGQIDGSFLNSIVRLTTVDLEEIGTSTATEINVSVKSSLDLEAILGLDAADFVLLDAGGSSQTIDTVVDNLDGTYTLTGTGLVSGTLNLVSAATLSVTGFESSGPIDITI